MNGTPAALTGGFTVCRLSGKKCRKRKEEKENWDLKKKKKRNSRILHDPEHRGSAGGVETLVEKVDSFSGIFF